MADHSWRPSWDMQPDPVESQREMIRQSPLSNDFAQQALDLVGGGPDEQKQMVLYLSLNSTTHHKDELPETLRAAKHAKEKGLGDYSVLPISDPYANGTSTYKHSFGDQHAEDITFWHDDPKNMKEGEIKFGEEEPIMLGTENAKDETELVKIQANWKTTLTKLGMDDDYADKTITALLKDADGNPKKLGSGDGATNELLQYTMSMYRAEKGEFEVSSLVFSGHHWAGDRSDHADMDVLSPNADGSRNPNSTGGIGKGIWGEKPNHAYDYRSDDGRETGGDFFSMEDVGALKDAFPIAYSQVDSVQFAACNTDSLGMTDDKGKEQSTPEWLQSTFSDIKMASYWEGLAPLAISGANYNGEFMLDHAKMMSGDTDAAKDARYTGTSSATAHRAVLNDKGVLEQIDVQKDNASYFGGKGLRKYDSSYTSKKNKKDVGDHLYEAPDIEQDDTVWRALQQMLGIEKPVDTGAFH
jgi:hypothetical protein